MSFDANKYIPVIDAILRVSDLEVITARRIRRGIQELFAVDLSGYKKEVDGVIMDRFLKTQQNLKELDSRGGGGHDEYPDLIQDKYFAERLSTELNRRDLREAKRKRTERAPRTPQVKRKKREETDAMKTAKENNPFNRPMVLSTELAELLGEKELSRPQTVKLLWKYIKDHELQNPEDKREIVFDDALKRVFDVEKVTSFSLNKHLTKHLYKKDELVGQGSNTDEEEQER